MVIAGASSEATDTCGTTTTSVAISSAAAGDEGRTTVCDTTIIAGGSPIARQPATAGIAAILSTAAVAATSTTVPPILTLCLCRGIGTTSIVLAEAGSTGATCDDQRLVLEGGHKSPPAPTTTVARVSALLTDENFDNVPFGQGKIAANDGTSAGMISVIRRAAGAGADRLDAISACRGHGPELNAPLDIDATCQRRAGI